MQYTAEFQLFVPQFDTGVVFNGYQADVRYPETFDEIATLYEVGFAFAVGKRAVVVEADVTFRQ